MIKKKKPHQSSTYITLQPLYYYACTLYFKIYNREVLTVFYVTGSIKGCVQRNSDTSVNADRWIEDAI